MHEATPHTPAEQAAVSFAGAQVLPQPPQCAVLARMFTSHPFATRPSQLAKPVAHAPIPHDPPAQAAVAFGGAHPLPQPPQWAVLVLVSTSQPSE